MAETLVVQAEMAELERVRVWADAIGERLGLPQSTLFAIHLCFEEAVSNIVRHGFVPHPGEAPPNKDVRLALAREDGAVTATIEDHGVAFDPLGVTDPAGPATLDEATVGGLGISLMRQFAQHLAYERRDGINRLTLRFAPAEGAG
jgi:anti-sigma regulatory factor (Ser/Thr protein kinase)